MCLLFTLVLVAVSTTWTTLRADLLEDDALAAAGLPFFMTAPGDLILDVLVDVLTEGLLVETIVEPRTLILLRGAPRLLVFGVSLVEWHSWLETIRRVVELSDLWCHRLLRVLLLLVLKVIRHGRDLLVGHLELLVILRRPVDWLVILLLLGRQEELALRVMGRWHKALLQIVNGRRNRGEDVGAEDMRTV